jgi:pimeloyl-ACP methyl ester carboxylesterase
MDAQPRKEFEGAQARTLHHHGIEVERRSVRVPTLEGNAHVLLAGRGAPVVMINGIGTPGAMWAPLMAHLPGHGLHVIDLPGYGLTDPPPDGPTDLRSHAVGFLESVLDGLGLVRPAFVGNSLGSLFALWLAIDRPERVGPMAHIGCPALAPGTSAPLPMRALSVRGLGRILMRLQPPSPGQVEQLSKMVHQHPLPPEIAAVILATERMPGFERTFRSNLRALLRLRGSRPRTALTEPQLGAVTQPSLLIFGRSDPMGSERAGRRMARALPDAELQLTEGGHVPWLDDPVRIAGWIDRFLDRHAPSVVRRTPHRQPLRGQAGDAEDLRGGVAGGSRR